MRPPFSSIDSLLDSPISIPLVWIFYQYARSIDNCWLHTILWKRSVSQFYAGRNGLELGENRYPMYPNNRQRSATRCNLQLQITSVCWNLELFCFWLKRFLLRLARAKSHAIFSDTVLNSEHVVYLNIYQNLLLTAMKMHQYIRDWGVSGRRNNSFLRSKFRTVVVFCLLTLCGSCYRKNDCV